MGCYRYQDIPTLPKEGLSCLLWDVPEERYKQVAESLKSRALIEFKNGKYWLHPEVRAKAIQELRIRKDWEKTNYEVANFWFQSFQTVESVEDALKAFEAFYHFVEVKDFVQAAKVLLESKNNDVSGLEHLGYACWRLGLFRQIISAINLIQDKVDDPYMLSSFNRILGYAQNLMGNIRDAIQYHEKSGEIALQYLNSTSASIESNIQNSEIDDYRVRMKGMVNAHLINIGIAKLDLWELEEALALFEKGSSLSKSEAFGLKRYWIEDVCCLALAKSYLGNTKDAYILAEEASSNYKPTMTVMSQWGKAYVPLLLGKVYKNLGRFDKAFEMYQMAVDYAETCSYSQAKANAMTGFAELYRERKSFSDALSHHFEAISLLEKIEAKCDLAEAYFQLALTHQVIGNLEKCRKYAAKAVQLYERMQAPRQVERVRRAIEDAEL